MSGKAIAIGVLVLAAAGIVYYMVTSAPVPEENNNNTPMPETGRPDATSPTGEPIKTATVTQIPVDTSTGIGRGGGTVTPIGT